MRAKVLSFSLTAMIVACGGPEGDDIRQQVSAIEPGCNDSSPTCWSSGRQDADPAEVVACPVGTLLTGMTVWEDDVSTHTFIGRMTITCRAYSFNAQGTISTAGAATGMVAFSGDFNPLAADSQATTTGFMRGFELDLNFGYDFIRRLKPKYATINRTAYVDQGAGFFMPSHYGPLGNPVNQVIQCPTGSAVRGLTLWLNDVKKIRGVELICLDPLP